MAPFNCLPEKLPASKLDLGNWDPHPSGSSSPQEGKGGRKPESRKEKGVQARAFEKSSPSPLGTHYIGHGHTEASWSPRKHGLGCWASEVGKTLLKSFPQSHSKGNQSLKASVTSGGYITGHYNHIQSLQRLSGLPLVICNIKAESPGISAAPPVQIHPTVGSRVLLHAATGKPVQPPSRPPLPRSEGLPPLDLLTFFFSLKTLLLWATA